MCLPCSRSRVARRHLKPRSLRQTNQGRELLGLLAVRRAERLRDLRNRVTGSLSSRQITRIPHQLKSELAHSFVLGKEGPGRTATPCTQPPHPAPQRAPRWQLLQGAGSSRNSPGTACAMGSPRAGWLCASPSDELQSLRPHQLHRAPQTAPSQDHTFPRCLGRVAAGTEKSHPHLWAKQDPWGSHCPSRAGSQPLQASSEPQATGTRGFYDSETNGRTAGHAGSVFLTQVRKARCLLEALPMLLMLLITVPPCWGIAHRPVPWHRAGGRRPP